MSRAIVRSLVVVLPLAAMGPLGEARADQPFYYYPAYGAHRGKIVNRQGPFVSRQKVRWGGGLTPYGAQVIGDAITAFAPIVGGFIGKEAEVADKSADERAALELCESYAAELRRANDLLVRSAMLLGHDLSSPPRGAPGGPVVPPPVPVVPPPAPGNDGGAGVPADPTHGTDPWPK